MEHESRALTATEKFFAAASGKASVQAGDIVYPDPELVIVHDGYVEAAHRELIQLGYQRISRPERVMFVTDHEVAYTTQRALERGRANRRIAAEWRVGHFFDAGQGGHGHVFPMEQGIVRPGSFIAAYDSHCSNFGAIGAYALATGPDITVVLATGTMWVEVPRSIRVEVRGSLRPGVHPRDIGFHLASRFKSGDLGLDVEAAVIEFGGEGTDDLDVASRVGMINTLTEIGVAHVLFPPMSVSGDPIAFPELVSDPGAIFAGVMELDLSKASPQVALPGAPSNAVDVADVAGRRVDHAFIGSCGSGFYEDFAAAARMMNGRKLARGVRLFVVPGTVATAERMMRDGLAAGFMEAGAIVLPPGCGPCAGGVMAPVGPGELSISTAATNGPGRMGSKDAQCFLASPLTVAASAVIGHISDPRDVLV